VRPIDATSPAVLSASAQKTSGLLPSSQTNAQTVSPALSVSRRAQIMLDDANNSATASAVISGERSAPLEKKRAVRRCQLVASAEVIERDAQTKLSARISEIGLGGCYVDTLSPFPNGTLVRIRIIRDGGAFECEAKVVYVQDGFGMGIAFTNVALDQSRLLQNWIADLVVQLK